MCSNSKASYHPYTTHVTSAARAMVLLPLCGEQGYSASSSAASSSGGTSSIEVRDAVNKVFFPEPSFTAKPEDDAPENVCANVLQKYAALLLETHQGGVTKRQRLRSKSPMSKSEFLKRILRDPWNPLVIVDLSWEARRLGQDFMAGALSVVASQSVRKSRDYIRNIWNNTPDVIKQNAHSFLVQFGKPDMNARSPKVAEQPPDEVLGVLCTWQTKWGRHSDFLGRLLEAGVSLSDTEEVCRGNESMIEYFNEFSAFVEQQTDKYGFSVYSCSLELNSDTSGVNKVHLHAYVCVNWKLWKQPEWGKRIFQRKWWTYQHEVPHVVFTNIRPNANPVRQLSGATYYVVAPKIGSIFRRCSLRMWKDTRSPLQHFGIRHVSGMSCR